jgi:hypothetical protein
MYVNFACRDITFGISLSHIFGISRLRSHSLISSTQLYIKKTRLALDIPPLKSQDIVNILLFSEIKQNRAFTSVAKTPRKETGKLAHALRIIRQNKKSANEVF